MVSRVEDLLTKKPKEKAPVCVSCRNTATKCDAELTSSVPFWYCETCGQEVNDIDWSVFKAWPTGIAIEPTSEKY